MYKIDNNRKIVLENGLIEVDRFPRDWKIGANQLWNLGRENALKLVRVMDPNFKDARLYKSERVEDAPPGVVELPRYYAIGISQKNDWYTEDGLLVGAEMPSDIIERAKQKLVARPFVEALRKNWFSFIAASMFLALTVGLLTGVLTPSTDFWSIMLGMAMAWLKIGLPFCAFLLFMSTASRYLNNRELREALEESRPVQVGNPQPLASSQPS